MEAGADRDRRTLAFPSTLVLWSPTGRTQRTGSRAQSCSGGDSPGCASGIAYGSPSSRGGERMSSSGHERRVALCLQAALTNSEQPMLLPTEEAKRNRLQQTHGQQSRGVLKQAVVICGKSPAILTLQLGVIASKRSSRQRAGGVWADGDPSLVRLLLRLRSRPSWTLR
ncbi:Hypothetical predicted protein [Marmota monax]|uniref:Uncharacterized protein n=1 Tax=Marmota monax TaxID=9995 RepID=A0A5E4CLA5_MARMO|nr:Hypothetical predicted protein [Marmota monax]